MNSNKIKNKILKELPLDDYKEYEKGNKSKKEWYGLCAIVNDMIKDGFVFGKGINHNDDDFEIRLTLDGANFLDKGGYKHQAKFFSNIITIISIIVTTISIIIGIKTCK